jgi:hypothetical protein
MCMIQTVQSHGRFSSFANADSNVLRRPPQRADRHTKSPPKHTLPGPPWHSASAGGPGPRTSVGPPPRIDVQADEGQQRKSFKNDQLAFWLGDLLRPRDTPHSAAKISKLLHILHTDRGHPRHAKLHCITRLQLLHRHVAQSVLGRCAGRRCISSRWRRGRHGYVPAAGGLLDAARSPTSRSKEGKRAGERFLKAARVSWRAERVPGPRRLAPLFIHRTRRFGKPTVQQYCVHQRSHQKPPRNHFERGQRLHHLATSLAPDDLVELVPRRANVGAKARTLLFARCLCQSRCDNGSKATGSSHPSSDKLQDEGQRRGRLVLRPRPT